MSSSSSLPSASSGTDANHSIVSIEALEDKDRVRESPNYVAQFASNFDVSIRAFVRRNPNKVNEAVEAVRVVLEQVKSMCWELVGGR